MDHVSAFTPLTGPAVERDVAFDLARRALIVAPVIVLGAGLLRGAGGAWGAVFALAVVIVNYLLAAALITWAAGISAAALSIAAVGGFVMRLILIAAVAIGVRQLGFVNFPAFLVILAATHVGLLFWEMRHVSLSLASPGLKPKKEKR